MTKNPSRGSGAALALFAALSGVAAWAGCGGSGPESANSRQAIETAVDRHLAKRSDLDFSSMQIKVEEVEFQGSARAMARVSFRAGDQPGAAMAMNYSLRKRGGEWEVEPPASGGAAGNPHSQGGGGGLPSNHPPLEGADQELPPGHPPVQ